MDLSGGGRGWEEERVSGGVGKTRGMDEEAHEVKDGNSQATWALKSWKKVALVSFVVADILAI